MRLWVVAYCSRADLINVGGWFLVLLLVSSVLIPTRICVELSFRDLVARTEMEMKLKVDRIAKSNFRTHSIPQASQNWILVLLGFHISSITTSLPFPFAPPLLPLIPGWSCWAIASLAAFLDALSSSSAIVTWGPWLSIAGCLESILLISYTLLVLAKTTWRGEEKIQGARHTKWR